VKYFNFEILPENFLYEIIKVLAWVKRNFVCGQKLFRILNSNI